MRRIAITCEAQATISERWSMIVPDDFDITDEQNVLDAFFNMDDPDIEITFIDEQAKHEHERDITNWEVTE
jgi:hypothetical protein